MTETWNDSHGRAPEHNHRGPVSGSAQEVTVVMLDQGVRMLTSFLGPQYLHSRDTLYLILYVAQTWAPPGQRNGEALQVPSVYIHAVPLESP